ncbi:hypothetical protein UQ79_21060, partial [Shigella dysenteriae]|uniref:hypothetical protein n=1 Tax=Shigella dysenteriae TaxID=622 RepID=UPI000EEAD74B
TVYQYDNGLLNFLGIPQENSPPKIFTVAICHESLSFPIRSSERSVAYFMASVNAVLKINAINITLWVLQFLVF